MQSYTEILPPTAVSHAIVAPLISRDALNLIVAKTSLLQIFEIRTVAGQDTPLHGGGSAYPTFNSRLSTVKGPRQKLVLKGEFPLAGTVTSLASARVPNSLSGGDVLLVSFETAKISIVEWDPQANSISNQSIHYYENQPEIDNSSLSDPALYSSWLCIDPQSTCALLKFGKRSLAIIPFRQSGDVGPDDPDAMIEDEADARQQRRLPRFGDSTSDKRQLPPLPTLPSYTLITTHLDPLIREPIDMAFLHEYREPTLGILYATHARSKALAALDTASLTFVIYTLDIAGRARTRLFSVEGLPQDMFKVVPLPLPVGGVLLVGTGQIVHVDQSGKTYAVAVNPFALQNTSFSMNDQSHLNLKLEHCVITRMSHNLSSLLLVLRSGSLATLTFKLEGRNLSSINVEHVPAEKGRDIVGGAASCAALVGLSTVFVGSAQSDGVLFECQSSMPELHRKRTHADMLENDKPTASSEDAMDEDDDLYGDSDKRTAKREQEVITMSEMPSDISFVIQDLLPNYASLTEPAIMSRSSSKTATDLGAGKLDLVLPTGINAGGSLSFLHRHVRTLTSNALVMDMTPRRVFTVSTKDVADRSSHLPLLIVDHANEDGPGLSTVYRTSNGVLEAIEGTDFEREVETLFAGTLANGELIVQVTPRDIRTYDREFNLNEMHPMEDQETGTEFSIQHVSFADPYLLAIRDDASAILLKIDESGDLQELERGEQLQEIAWTSGCLHSWTSEGSDATMYLLSEKGALHIYALPDISAPIYVAEDLRNLPPVLTASSSSRRGGVPEPLAEILIAQLGDRDASSPYMIIRTESGDVELYEPFQRDETASSLLRPKQLRWIKRTYPLVGSLGSAAPEVVLGQSASEDQLRPQMVPLSGIAGYDAVFVPGAVPAFIFKQACSLPKVLPYERTDVYSAALLETSPSKYELVIPSKTNGGVKGSVQIESLSGDYRFGDLGWASKRLHLGVEADFLAYHPIANRLIVSVDEPVEFTLPDDEAAHHAWVKEEIPLRPQATHSSIQLLDPETWQITDIYSMPHAYEQVACMTVAHIEISEKTHERRSLLAVGTAMVRGEDLPANGCVYLFDIVRVAPDPARPGTELALKLLVREEVRGFVTALAEAGDQGLLLMAMGQKLNVRGLTEAGTLLPAAFMDAQIRVKGLKNLKGTGMSLVADSLKGVWFVGFQAEPFQMHMLGKARSQLRVAATEFLPHENQLMIVVADDHDNLHMLEYKPEHPLSQSGQRLLHKAAIHCGHGTVSMKLLPCIAPSGFEPPASQNDGDVGMTNGHTEPMPASFPAHQVLVTHSTGAIGLVHSLSEASYRRLTALQTYMTNVLDSPCGLNVRSHRAVDPSLVNWKGAVVEGSTLGASGGNRSVVDGSYAARWRELGVRGRAEAWGRVGGFVAGAQPELIAGIKDVEILRGAGLAYF